MWFEVLHLLILGGLGFIAGWFVPDSFASRKKIRLLKARINELEDQRTRDLRWHSTTRDGLKVELSLRPPSVDKWVLGIAGIAEVFEVTPEKATRILDMGVGFPAPFAYVDRTRIYDRDAVITWYEEEYPRYKHLIR